MTTHIKYRITTSPDVPTSTSAKGEPLTSLEIDGNFKSIVNSVDAKLNSADLAESTGSALVGYGESTVQSTLQAHDAKLANVEGNLNFDTLPAATLPVADTDLLLLRQGSSNKKVAMSVARTEFATNAVIAKDQAVAAKDAAVSAKTAAEAARDATVVGAAPTVYATAAAGLAATTSGQYFSVPSADSAEYLILYLNSSGTAVEQKRYPSTAKTDPTQLSAIDGYQFAISDELGRAALAVRNDGQVVIKEMKADSFGLGIDASSGDIVADADKQYVFKISDANGNYALTVDTTGRFQVGETATSGTATPTIPRYAGVYHAQLNYICTAGQSLAQGSDGQITTTQEYDNIGFSFSASGPTQTYPLTTGGTGYNSQESPMYGTAGHIKELILEENDLTYQVNDYQLLSGNVGSSGAPIEEINKGGSRGMYEASISQVQSGYNIATSQQKTFAFQAVTWTQGESNTATPKDTYKTLLKQLAKDYNTDGKAITGQNHDVQFISYQLCRSTALNTVTPAQLEASEEVPYIHIATPTYFLDFYDLSTHVTAQSSKWLGGYYGLCYKRTVIDRLEWSPLKPVHHAIVGNAIDLYFNKEGLVFDSTIVPTQTNQGFAVVDGSGNAITISSVAIVKPNRVRITCASAPQPGWRVKYGHNSIVGKATYNGPGGNLRDSQGDTLVYSAINKPMHNWCVIFNYEV